MFRLIVGLIWALGGVSATFGHHKFLSHLNKHITYDMNGFKGHHGFGHGMHYGRPPVVHHPPGLPFGPFPQNHYPQYPDPLHYQHQQPISPEFSEHRPQFQYNNQNNNNGNGFPNMDGFPFNLPFFGPNMPFNPILPFSLPNPFDGRIPNQGVPPNNPLNQPFDPLSTPQLTPSPSPHPPFDANTFTNPTNVQNPSAPSTVNNVDSFNNANAVGPQNGATTKPKSDPNNDNSITGTGANTMNNNNNNNNMNTNDQSMAPNVNKPELTTSPNQSNDDLIYDIDVRFGGPNDNRTNQKPLNKN